MANPPPQWEWMTETGYDDYSKFPASTGLTTALDNTYTTVDYLLTSYNNFPEYAQQLLQSAQTKGLVTWTKHKVLSSVGYAPHVNIYDKEGRLIQTKSTSVINGKDVTTMQYSWNGKLLRKVEKSDGLFEAERCMRAI